MLFKDKYLPLKNLELSEDEIRFLIKKIDYWLYLTCEEYCHNFWCQSNLRWFSTKERFKREMKAIDLGSLDRINQNLKRAKLFDEKFILNNDDFKLINTVYKKMKLLNSIKLDFD
ncbi:hypothetical protein [Clostridium akagii]|uniref:hypothetical protein n=1 Tax=Clostridium akagii TaxID=91623 RepID=UPI000479FC85|nr:hypothetical protein [Clostridium akagii]